MAPIYTAKHVSSADATIPLFSIKGLPNLAPSTISSLDVIGYPLERQVAFSQYADNLAAFIHANQQKKRVTVRSTPYGFLKTSETLPLPRPTVQFVLQKEIDFDTAEKFIRSLGPGASKEKSGKTTIFKAPALPTPMLTSILKLSASHYNCGRDAVTPAGMAAYNILSAAIVEILKIHTYAAFPSSTSLKDTLVEFRTAHQKSMTTYESAKSTDGKQIIDIGSFSRNVMDADETKQSGMDMDDSELLKKIRDSHGGITMSAVDTVVVAKPSPAPLSINVGQSGDIPNMPGLLFPYFKGLIQPDAQMLKTFMVRRLFQLLGTTQEKCQEQYQNIRRGLNSLATTDIGMTLSHIVSGIELALTTQGRCFVIIEAKEYAGFALLGAKFVVFDTVKWRAPETEEDLRKDIVELDPHALAAVKLTQLFTSMAVSQKYTGPTVSESTFNEPKSLADVLAGIKLDKLEDNEERELDQLFRSLNYMGPGYLAKNPQIISDALTTLFSSTVIALDRPTYIPSIRAPIATRPFVVLSRFGPEAPSLWNERGTLYPCEPVEAAVALDKKGKRKLGEMDTYANMPEQLLITPKPLSIAVKDMEKVINSGGVKMDLKERSKKYRNISVEAEAMRKLIWGILVEGLKDSRKKQKTEKKPAADVSEAFDDVMSGLLSSL